MKYYNILEKLSLLEYRVGQEIHIYEIGLQLFLTEKAFTDGGGNEKVSSHSLCISLLKLGLEKIFQFYTDFLMAFRNYLFILH